MKLVGLISLLVACTFAQEAFDTTNINSAGCGRRIQDIKPDRPFKVVGGQRADPEDWGWQIAMNYTGRFLCGGSLINSQWILTAAHCVYGRLNPAYYTIDLGLHDRSILEPWAITKAVSKVIMHPSYNPTGWRNDIALMKLEAPIAYSDQVLPVCVPDGSFDYPGKTSWATGWGTLSSGGSVSRYLMEVAMPFLTDQRCKQKYPTVDSNIAVCAGETGENKDTCQGDSGGPLVVKHDNGRWYVSGITSWGYGCGDGGVYTRTSTYYNWIQQTIQIN